MGKEASEISKDGFPRQIRMEWTRARREVETRIQMGTKWLISRQEEEGYWGEESPWITGLVLRALSLARNHSSDIRDSIDSSAERAISWLDANCHKYSSGLYAWDPELGTYDTSVVVRGLIAWGYQNSKLVENSVDWLLLESKERWYGRSEVAIWEYFPAQMLIVLKEIGYSEDKDAGRIACDILKTLERMQKSDGSWGNDYDTPEILEAIVTLSNEKKDSVQKALRWIEITQTEQGNWGGLPQITSKMLYMYISAHQNPHNETTAQALAWLISTQHSNGSWFHVIEDTTFTVITLCKILSIIDFSRFDRLSPFLPFPNIDYRSMGLKEELEIRRREILRFRKWFTYSLTFPLILGFLGMIYLIVVNLPKEELFALIAAVIFQFLYSLFFYKVIRPHMEKTSRWYRPLN